MASSDSTRVKRPFWMHQTAEYVLGLLLVGQGLQSPTPVPPAIAGGLVLVNAAVVRGPLSAFRLVSRPTHRVLDVMVVVAVVVLAVQPVVDVESGARLVMVAIAGVMGFIWWQSSFEEKQRTRGPVDASGGVSSEVGRLAGRAVGDGIAAAKRLKRR